MLKADSNDNGKKNQLVLAAKKKPFHFPAGLEINARKLAKCEWFWWCASEKNIH